jgi:hypothetical protein
MQHDPTPAQGAGQRSYTIPGNMTLPESMERALTAPIDFLSLGVFTYVHFLIQEGADGVPLNQITRTFTRGNERVQLPAALTELVQAELLVEVLS